MQATILDLRRRMPAVLRALDRNEQVIVLYRGKERAVLIPSSGRTNQRKRPRITGHAAFGMWADRKDGVDVAAHVRSLRQGRKHAL
jgi:antitoxin (DNA-binding transcriptional repressor) of toxin-antitoxin stability system